ncbi:MAG TPA: DUF4340 domain-containing protein [Candidatus Dormibacteraeota bacterium]|nr:DUF4340 domain-containing protein [Candidatus Dormibacteraeota bacterium]
MKGRGLLVAAIVLAALSGTLYWSNHKKATASSAASAVESPPKVLDIKTTDVTSIEVTKKGAEEIALSKNDAGKWQITSPKSLAADQDAVSSLLSTLSPLSSDRLVAEKATDLNAYGLAKPTVEISIAEKNKKERLLLGDDTPAGSGVFAAVAGDPRVFIIASYHKSSLDKSANDLRDKRLLTFDSEKLSRVELTAKKATIEFGRNKDQWQILKPKPLRADQSAVDDLVRSLHDAKMELSATEDEKKDTNAFKSGTVVATAKLTDVTGTQEVQVRKNKDDYYAKSSAVAGVYKVSSSVGTSIDKSLDDFRNKKLFDFGFVDPEKIEIHESGKSTFLTRSGSDWWSNGVKMDEGNVGTLVSDIRALTATKFPDSGFTTSSVEITVTSDDGKRVEKVLIAKSGAGYVGKRENEPALYELSAATIKDLEDAVAGLKPAPPPPPAAKKK